MKLKLLTCLLVASSAMASSELPQQIRWIWYPEGKPAQHAPECTRYFRGTFTIPTNATLTCAQFTVNADDTCSGFVNGTALHGKDNGWTEFKTYTITKQLRHGTNVIAIEVKNGGSAAGLIGWVELLNGKTKSIVSFTDESWKTADSLEAGWQQLKYNDSAWKPALVLGPATMAPWATMRYNRIPLMTLSKRSGDQPITAEQAQRMIEEDWLYQADDAVTSALILNEIKTARALAARLTMLSPHLTFTSELKGIAELEARVQALQPPHQDEPMRELYFAVRREKRSILFRNPLLNFDRILLMDTPHYASPHESAHRNGYHYNATTGSRMLILEGLRPDGKEQELIPETEGYLMRMDLSFDASKIVFSLKPKQDKSFHLYEIGVDGQKRRQLTNSLYDDMDPIYLPDGRILFSTSRGNSYVRCLPQSASTVLARCDPDGKNIVMLSRNNEPDYTPALLNDGRVLYTRWEYTERPLWRLQKLWTMNPDGTGEALYWGNGSAYPDMLWEARPVPGSGQVMFAGVGHHNVFTGCIGLLDVTRGLQFPDGITKVTQELPWPECGDPKEGTPGASATYQKHGALWSVRSPYPLGPEDYLASVSRTSDDPFSLYLMDIHGNRELIYTGKKSVWYARPLLPRTPPPALPDMVAWPAPGEQPKEGVLFSPNVYAGMEGVPAGTIKYLRVLEMDAKTYSMGFKSWRHSGPAISVIQEDGVKRILGIVPVQPDGSVSVLVPSGRALHFQLLDERMRCVQLMRSFTGVMPGETRGCVGCHSLHSGRADVKQMPQALSQKPAALTPPPWGASTSVSYERFCQPILDKYCGACHQGTGKGREKLDLTLRGGIDEGGINDPQLLPFKEPYLTLIGPTWNQYKPTTTGAGLGLAGCINVETKHNYGAIKPMTVLSYISPLIELVTSGKHNKVKIEGEDLQRLMAWVDCNCVYRGDEEVRQIPDPPPNIANRFPVPVKTKTAPVISRLHAVTDTLP